MQFIREVHTSSYNRQKEEIKENKEYVKLNRWEGIQKNCLQILYLKAD